VLKPIQRVTYLLKLICDLVADEYGFHTAVGTRNVLGSDLVRNRLSGKILEENVLFVIPVLRLFDGVRHVWTHCFTGGQSRSGIVALGFRAVIIAISLLPLCQKLVELGLQFNQKRAQLGIAFQAVPELVGEIGDELVGFLELLAEPSVLLLQGGKLRVIWFWHGDSSAAVLYMIPLRRSKPCILARI